MSRIDINKPAAPSREGGIPDVAVEMERIFGGVADVGPAPARVGHAHDAAKRSAADAEDQPRPSRSRRMRWPIVIVPLLAVIVAGLLLFPLDQWLDARWRGASAPPSEFAPPAARRTVALAPRPQPTTPAPTPAPTVEIAQNVAPSPTPSVTPAAAKTASATRRPARASARKAPAPVVASRDRAYGEERPRSRRASSTCGPGSTSDACIYRDVRYAHNRLVKAYLDAAQAGVDRRDLIDARRRWDRARDISLEEPDETIRRYDDLTAYLRTASRVGSSRRNN